MPLPASLASDLDHVLRHVGDAVVWRGTALDGRLSKHETEFLDPSGTTTSMRRTVLLVRQVPTGGAFDDVLTVGGVSYRVRDIGRVRNDGLIPIVLSEEP